MKYISEKYHYYFSTQSSIIFFYELFWTKSIFWGLVLLIWTNKVITPYWPCQYNSSYQWPVAVSPDVWVLYVLHHCITYCIITCKLQHQKAVCPHYWRIADITGHTNKWGNNKHSDTADIVVSLYILWESFICATSQFITMTNIWKKLILTNWTVQFYSCRGCIRVLTVFIED